MAGDWIKMRVDLADDPAVIGMADRLGVDEFAIVGRLHRLWSWADAQSRDGHAYGVTKAWIDKYVRCDGFATQMQTVSWLTVTETGIEFPKFSRHNGETAKTRASATKRKQNQRSKVTDETGQTSRDERDKNKTREEKRREELTQHIPRTPAQVSIVLRKYTIDANPSHPSVIAMAEQGIDLDTLEACCKETREAKPNEKIAIGYIVSKLQGWKRQAELVKLSGGVKAKAVDRWWESHQSMDAKARELGIPGAKVGEQPGAFKSRIQQAIDGRSAA